MRYPLAVIVLPTLAAAGYFGVVAAPVYVSESKFIVRMAAAPATECERRSK